MSKEIEPVRIEDLRPALGDLNWQLRRMNLAVTVTVRDTGVVESVNVVPQNCSAWTITCNQCATVYAATQEKFPKCPTCGKLEGRESAPAS